MGWLQGVLGCCCQSVFEGQQVMVEEWQKNGTPHKIITKNIMYLGLPVRVPPLFRRTQLS